MVSSEELIDTIKYMTLLARCRINRCRYKRVLLFIKFCNDFHIGRTKKDGYKR
jgi:hypothetical protein